MPRHMKFRIPRRRRPAIGLIGALVIAAVVVGPPALASRQHAHRGVHGTASAAYSNAGPAAQDAVAAVERLVDNGTIDRHQADVIDSEINVGSIDPKQLVHDGVLTDAQMHAVASAIDQVKRSFHG